MKKIFTCILTSAILFAGLAAKAQSPSGQFVIKIDGHYLAHVRNGDNWELQDATTFSPNCLWFSDNTFTQGGTNKNYYFYDHTNTARFLGAPLFEALGALTLSTTVPAPSLLNNPEQQYYFYKWDDGLGRGKQYYGVPSNWCEAHHHGWNGTECWEVYWVEYNTTDNEWKLSTESYDITDNGGKFYAVSITEHPGDTTTVSGGLSPLAGFEMEYVDSPHTTHQVTPTIEDYKYSVVPEYTTYVFQGGTHNYYGDVDHGTDTPDAVTSGTNAASACTYKWTLTGAGASYLTIDNNTSAAPTITYSTVNNDGHKEATLTLTVTYGDGSKQTSTATILVKTPCQNPSGVTATVNNLGVTISWAPTADAYTVSWKKTGAASWSSASVGNVTSYTLTGLEFETEYTYKVQATCDSNNPTEYTFTTLADPGLVVAGGIFGGGRMADVSGNTEVVIINSGLIDAVYGGNDIAGSVGGAVGSKIILGVDENDPEYDADYGHTTAAINIGSVYGGGNGYYAYNGSSFVAASADYTEQSVAAGGHVNLITPSHEVGGVVWTNTGTEAKTLAFPSIVKTAITVTNDFVKVDSVFGGAKNAFLTDNDNSENGSSITVNGGTIYAVFGGNNFGGSQGYAKHYIEVNATAINLAPDIANTSSAGYGRTFGIRYLFGGGNKVEGSTTDIHILGGQCDNVFAGGNAADIFKANVEVNCSLGDIPDNTTYTFGNTYSNAINPSNYTSGTIGTTTLDANYGWDGHSGIYNVRTLYGGNNEAEMTRLPSILLTSGSVGTVYGGGNAGDMMAVSTDDGAGGTLVINGDTIVHGTYVLLNSDKIIVDYIYGGCRMSNVANSTWVRLKKGHVGTVYGGCNISGDVGSTRVYDPYPSGQTYPQNLEEQRVLGGTYVQAGAGGDNTDLIVYKNIYAGSNGYYDCSDDGIHYNNDAFFDDPTGQYAGLTVPTHNETNVIVSKGTTVKGNVYAGGNLASVGFFDNQGFYRGYPELVGLASVRMEDGLVEGDVYGGGNMASIHGINEVRVTGGTINGALYGGNDRTGTVAERTNRILPAEYTIASDGKTSLSDRGVKTYIGVSGTAHITSVFGGGNGDYDYTSIQYCGTEPVLPIQGHTFVDIHIDGGASGGHIRTVYGGGDGISIWGDAVVFLNVKDPVNDHNHVDMVFGGNNKGDLTLVPEIILLHGQVGTVYGGCNQGAMTASGANLKTFNVNNIEYNNIGSYVQLRETFVASADSTHIVDAKVTNAVYGGCRMNGVSQNSLVLVEGGDHSNVKIFGGSDISGTIENTSRVVVAGGTVGDVFGGGNGDYDYGSSPYQGLSLPYSNTSCVDMLEGTAANLFAGGNACSSGATLTQVNGGLVTTGIYGGCNTRGAVVGDAILNIYGGTIGASGAGNEASIFGGGFGQETSVDGDVTVNFGDIIAEASEFPKLIGNLYGGSALGNVNTNNTNITEINILNGSITGPVVGDPIPENNIYGYVFGGGLGRKAGTDPAVEALVKGKVYIKIGKTDSPPSSMLGGKATLVNCTVFGCNNTNGSPQDEVFVDVYQTAHVDGVNTVHDAGFAILRVFGGGNEANYLPADNSTFEKKTHVYVHGCDNTIKYVYGGGNAADAVGVETIVEGGHFDEIYGGGNGAVVPANIGDGGIGINVMAGHISYLYEGCNKQGDYPDPINNPIPPQPPVGYCSTCGDVIVETFFFGDNEAEHYGDIERIIECDEAENYHYSTLFAGSRWALVYGDIKLTLCGGVIERLFGGSKGYALDGIPAHVRRFPTAAEIEANPGKYSTALKSYIAAHPELVGHGGNIELTILGGTIGEVIGGCDEYGNVEGKIMVIIDDAGDSNCPLHVGDVFGASNMTVYEPWNDNQNQIYFYNSPNNAHITSTPKVVVIKGTTGLDYDFDGPSGAAPAKHFEGNLYGGGNAGHVTSDPIVVIGDGTTGSSATPVTIGGSVYGGGNEGDVIGSPKVVVVPEKHTLTFGSPTPAGSGTFTVTYPRGRGVSGTAEVHTGDGVGEGVILKIVATPTPATGRAGVGYLFKRWIVTGEGAEVNRPNSPSTLFTMGTANATLQAEFEQVEAFQLAVAADPAASGSFKVNGTNYTGPVWVAQTASVTVEATPIVGMAFHEWEVSGSGSVSSLTQSTTTFTMGGANATLTAHFVPAHTLTMEADPSGMGTFKVQGANYSEPVWVAESTKVSVVATPASGYLFDHWEIVSGTGASITNLNSSSTDFTMGTDNATLRAHFVSAHTLTMVPDPTGSGTFKVNSIPYSGPVLIPDNSTVPVVATPAAGYVFHHWEVSGTGASVASTTSASTTLTVGAADVTLTAVFLPAKTLTLMSDPASAGSFRVNDVYYDGPVLVGQGTQVSIKAYGANFLEFVVNSGGVTLSTPTTVGNNVVETTFTMGTENVTITARFNQ